MMKKVLVLAYAVSPTRGSEYSVAWNYIVNMSRTTHLTVVYGTSGEHLGDIDELQDYLKENMLPNVTFIPLKPNDVAERLNKFNKQGKFVYTFYLAFKIWHQQAYELAKKLTEKEKFDVVHYLVPIGYREPGYLWKLDLPYIWGPVGGTYSVPLSLMKALGTSGKMKLGFRKIANWVQLNFKKSLKKAIESTDVLIAATTFDQKNLEKRFRKKVCYLPENGITQEIDQSEKDYFSEKLNIIWIGTVDARKALVILLEALKKLKNQNVSLHILGEGSLKEYMQQFAKTNNLNHMITWHGSVTRERVMDLLFSSHLHVLTSLTEANTTVMWESMASGVPSMALDHCGMHDIICENCGIKVPINSYEKAIEHIADKLDYYNDNRDDLKKLSEGVAVCAQKYKWSERVKFWEEMYALAIDHHARKKQKI